jgi:hypothetical protein
MSKRFSRIASLMGLVLLAPAPADAASRTYCLCKGKESGRLHHRFACEYHFKKQGRWPAVGAPSVASAACTGEERAQFKTYLCVESRCTYEYVRFSPSKVPLGTK